MQNDVLNNVLAFATLISVFVLAIVQLIKNTVSLPKNAVPWIGLLIGLLIGAVAYPFSDLDLTLRLWGGGLAGLSATGLFELVLSNRAGNTKQ